MVVLLDEFAIFRKHSPHDLTHNMLSALYKKCVCGIMTNLYLMPQCIAIENRCDNVVHCVNGMDEFNCRNTKNSVRNPKLPGVTFQVLLSLRC